PRAPPVDVPQGLVEIQGTAVLPPRRFLELSAETVAGNVWQNLSIERVARAKRLTLVPVVVLADTTPPGLLPMREKPDAGIERHRESSLTWYSLAATALALWVVLNIRRSA